jgi:TetR/AcrR family transcriptional regulator, ethionamide resistance regulator
VAIEAAHARRRRTPDEARREILDAAYDLLRTRPSNEVTVLAIMERTTLSRKSFYVYFQDRSALLAALVLPLRDEVDDAVLRWRAAPDPIAAGRTALRQAAELYHRHGAVLRALADASRFDHDAAETWRTFLTPVIDGAAAVITAATDGPSGDGLHVAATARALVNMNVAVFFNEVVGQPATAIDPVVDTLTTIWTRALFGLP